MNSLLRFAKFSKIYKIIRLTRLAKVFKLLKNNKSIISKLTEKLRISNGIERLIIFFCFFVLFVHVAACMFIVLAELESEDYVSWIMRNEGVEGFDLYIMSIYFTLTTVSTVGYGDILPGTEWERLYCTILMLVGVSAFTFISGALSSIISNYDQSQAALQEKFLHLNKLKLQVKMTDEMYNEIRSALTFEANQNNDDKLLINDLPLSLRMELSMILHK